MKKYVLDTNILVHNLKGTPLYEKVETTFKLSSIEVNPIISSVTKGELMSIAKQRGWGKDKVGKLDALLNQLISVDIGFSDFELHNAYAEIDAYTKRKLADQNGNLLPGSARKMGKNDLWIAATAKVLNADLLTADGDFNHLDGVLIKVHNVYGW